VYKSTVLLLHNPVEYGDQWPIALWRIYTALTDISFVVIWGLLHFSNTSKFRKTSSFLTIKKFAAFYGTRRRIIILTKARHYALRWASWIQSTSIIPSMPTATKCPVPLTLFDRKVARIFQYLCAVVHLPITSRFLGRNMNKGGNVLLYMAVGVRIMTSGFWRRAACRSPSAVSLQVAASILTIWVYMYFPSTSVTNSYILLTWKVAVKLIALQMSQCTE
jgi:hypothetical protein